MTPSIKLTYFDIEGRAEHVRLALTLAGVPFEDIRIKFPEWQELKPKTPGGKLPVIQIDDGPMKSQSGAMLRLVGSKFSETLYPADKLFEIEEAIGIMDDLFQTFVICLYIARAPSKFGHPEGFGDTPEGQAKVKELREKWASEDLPNFLKIISDMIEKNGNTFLVGGDNPTIADCYAVPILRNWTRGHVDHVPTTCLDEFPIVVNYIKRFCGLEKIKGRYTNGLNETS